MRMFVALIPPEPVVEDLTEFLAPRQEAATGLRWTSPEQWHVTLAFLAQVPERRLDDLIARLGRAAARRTTFGASIARCEAFPDVARAKVLAAGLETHRLSSSSSSDEPSAAGASAEVELRRLAVGVRAAANKAGAEAGGGRFRPHVTLARIGRPTDVTRWVRVLDAYTGPAWKAGEIALVASFLGEGPRGRPRHEVVETFDLTPLSLSSDTLATS